MVEESVSILPNVVIEVAKCIKISSTEPGSALPMPKTVPTKPYDWTYTTVYAGHDASPAGSSIEFMPADPTDEKRTIPISELTRPDPILFYAEIPLFEDELHDNGSSHLLVRIVS